MQLLKEPLSKYGVSYDKLEGGFLTGFKLTNVNYSNDVKLKELSLKVDLRALQSKVLKIDNLVVDGLEVDKDYLSSLIDSNGSTESNSTKPELPFDKVIVNHAFVSLKDIDYQEYHVSGLKLNIDNLETDMKDDHKGDLKLWVDSNVVKGDIVANLNKEHYHLKTALEAQKDFANRFLSEQNVTLEQNPILNIKADGDFEDIEYNVVINRLALQQNEYKIKSKRLNTFGNYSIAKKNLLNSLKGEIDSNVGNLQLNSKASLNIEDINNSLKFNVDVDFKPKESHLLAGLKEQNITIEKFPLVKLFAKGSMKKVTFKTKIEGLKAKQNDLALNLKDLKLDGNAEPLNGDIDVKLVTLFDSSISSGEVNLDSKLNYKDINSTLVFDLNSKLQPHGSYLNTILKESNVTLKGDSFLTLTASGSMKKVEFDTQLKGVKAKQNDIKFSLANLQLNGTTNPLSGVTNVKLLTNFSSSVADGRVDAQSKLNFNKLEDSLELVSSNANLNIHSKYINPLLKEQNLSMQGETKVKLKAKGKLENLTINLNAKTKLLKDRKLSNITLNASPVVLNLKKHYVEGSVKVDSDGKDIGLNLKSHFAGDYTKPKKMHIKNSLKVGHFNAFGVNLNSLQPLALNVENGDNGLLIKVNSPKLKLKATSRDNDHYIFKLHTQKIFIDKIVKVPKELKGKFIKANLEGDATISTQYFRVKGAVATNKNFKVAIDAKNNQSGLVASLKTKELKLNARGNLKKRDIYAKLSVNSIKALQKELSKLYPFDIQEIDGALLLKAHLKGESITAQLSSKKIAFEKFNIESLDLNTHYNKELLTLNKFNFKTTGFKDRRLNKSFYLNQKGLVYLGKKRDVLIDMHPNILVKAKGDSNNLKAKFKVTKLPLGYPEYGNVILSCNIDYLQKFKKKKITGNLFLDKLKIFYESKYLDPSQDNDVIVITKKDKEKKAGEDDFLQNTYIDVSIVAPEANYKTRDIDLKFTVDTKAKKKFGKTLRMLGKVKDIRGRVEQPPKVFKVVDSNIVFRGAKEINPLLDLKVNYELPDILITIGIHGNAKRPKLTFSSNPPLPKKDILSYLLLGVSTANLTNGKGSLGREAQLFIMNQAARDLAYDVDLDRVLIKDDGTGEGYAIQVGKKVSDNSMVIIENSKEGNSLLLEYDVNKNIKVDIGHHQKTVPSQSIDIYFRKRFR